MNVDLTLFLKNTFAIIRQPNQYKKCMKDRLVLNISLLLFYFLPIICVISQIPP